MYIFFYGFFKINPNLFRKYHLTKVADGTIKGYLLYQTDGGFPAAIKTDKLDKVVHGAIWDIPNQEIGIYLNELDDIEGINWSPPRYYRDKVTVDTDIGPLRADVYIGNPDHEQIKEAMQPEYLIKDGNFDSPTWSY